MKTLILFVLAALSINAQAAQWNCTGSHSIEKLSFDFTSTIENFKIKAPDLSFEKDAFVQVNAFTVAAYQVLDNSAQESIDYTFIVDRSAKTVQVFSQWSTNHNVDSETMNCK